MVISTWVKKSPDLWEDFVGLLHLQYYSYIVAAAGLWETNMTFLFAPPDKTGCKQVRFLNAIQLAMWGHPPVKTLEYEDFKRIKERGSCKKAQLCQMDIQQRGEMSLRNF